MNNYSSSILDLLQRYNQLAAGLRRRLFLYRIRRQVRVFFSRLFWSASAILGALLIFLLLERTPLQAELFRYLGTVVVYGALVLGAFLALRAFTSPPGSVALAVEIEHATGRFTSGLSSAAEFLAQDISGNGGTADDGTSSALRKLTIADAAEDLEDHDLVESLRRFSRWRSFSCMFLLAFFAALWYGFSTHEFRRGAERLFCPLRDLAPFSLLELYVYPGNHVLPKGEDIQISVVPNQPIEGEPVLTLFKPGALEGTTTEMYADETASRSRFVYTLTGLHESTDYQVSFDRAVSERYTIEVMQRPEITSLHLTLIQPTYISSGPQTLPEGQGDCRVLRGSRVRLVGEASQDLHSVGIIMTPCQKNLVTARPWRSSASRAAYADNNADNNASTDAAGAGTDNTEPAGAKKPAAVSGNVGSAALADDFLDVGTASCRLLKPRTFAYEFEVATTTRYSFLLFNRSNLPSINPVQYEITAIDDASPTVSLLRPAMDVPFPKDRRLDLKVAAKDDFGVVSVILYYSVGIRNNLIPLNMKADFAPTPSFEVDYPWLLDTMQLPPGSEITYFVQVEDNRRPIANVASTSSFKVSVPSMFDIAQGTDQIHGDLLQQLESYMQEQTIRREALSKAYEQIKHEKRLDYATEQELQKSIDKAVSQEKEAQEIIEKFKHLQERTGNNPFTAPELFEKMEKVEELLNQVLDEEAKQLRQQLMKALEQMQLDPKALEQFEQAFKMEEHLERLDRSIDLLTQLRDLQQINDLGQALSDLKRRQQAIASQTAELEAKRSGALPPEKQAELERLEQKEAAAKAAEKMAQNQEKTAGPDNQINEPQDGQKTEHAENNADQENLSETEPSETEPGETEPGETEPGEAQPDETQPSETQSGEAQPDETQPSETQPSETQPSGTQPGEAQPDETQPSKAGEQNTDDNTALTEEEQKRLEQLREELRQAQKTALSPEDKARLEDLVKQQEKIRRELENLQKLAEEMAKKQPKDGELQTPLLEDVKNIRDQMKQENFRNMSDQICKELGQEELQQAQQSQKQMLRFLEKLAQQGEQMCRSCSGGEHQRLDLSRFTRRAITIARDQEQLLRQIEGFPGQFMRGQKPGIEGIIDECSIRQVLVKEQAFRLEQALETFVRTSFEVDPVILDPIRGNQRILAAIVKDLEDRALDSARGAQRDIIHQFNHLAKELMRTESQAGSGESSGNPMDALQQFKQLAKQQLSLYQQQMQRQMMPMPIPQAEQMRQMQEMAMRQRMLREQLEQLMREGREQMRTLGRLDDVIQDMRDLETKILDPELQREIAERQKSIHERMLKALKAIRNRDEESEERKAEKAREIVQERTTTPLPALGTDSRDLSKDYLTDLKEEFPDAYRTMLQDYYKSLSLYGEQ